MRNRRQRTHIIGSVPRVLAHCCHLRRRHRCRRGKGDGYGGAVIPWPVTMTCTKFFHFPHYIISSSTVLWRQELVSAHGSLRWVGTETDRSIITGLLDCSVDLHIARMAFESTNANKSKSPPLILSCWWKQKVGRCRLWLSNKNIIYY